MRRPVRAGIIKDDKATIGLREEVYLLAAVPAVRLDKERVSELGCELAQRAVIAYSADRDRWFRGS
jgi:hypothetical protein